MLWHMRKINFINLKNKLLLSLLAGFYSTRVDSTVPVSSLVSTLPFALCHCRNSIKFISTFAGRRRKHAGRSSWLCLEGPALTIMSWHAPMVTMMKLVLFSGFWSYRRQMVLCPMPLLWPKSRCPLKAKSKTLFFLRWLAFPLNWPSRTERVFHRPTPTPPAHLLASFSVVVVAIFHRHFNAGLVCLSIPVPLILFHSKAVALTASYGSRAVARKL